MPKHGDTHIFGVANHLISCTYDAHFKQKPYWYPSVDLNEGTLNTGIDINKGFISAEACEKHIRVKLKTFATKLLKGLS